MREKVLNVLEEVDAEIILYDGNEMIKDGVVDSFDLIEIVYSLEKGFEVEIGAEYVTREYFANKNTIINLMELLLQKK